MPEVQLGRTLWKQHGFRGQVWHPRGVSYSWNVAKQDLRASVAHLVHINLSMI